MSENEGRSAQICITLTPELKDIIQKHARSKDLSMSTYVLGLIQKDLSSDKADISAELVDMEVLVSEMTDLVKDVERIVKTHNGVLLSSLG